MIRLATLVAVSASIGYRSVEARPGQTPAAGTDRKPDEEAIRKAREGFTAAFEKGDAAAAAAFLTGGAELIPDDVPPIRGRDAIQKAFTEHFAKTPRVTMAATSDSLRFTSRDTAVEEGRIVVTPAGGGSPTTNEFTIHFVREDGRWLLSTIRERNIDTAELNDLEWLIGSWTAKRADAEINSTYEWFGNRNFIRATFTIREKDKTFSGMQMIGLNPTTGELKSWTFEHDGGVGEGTIVSDGRRWVFETTASLADGTILEVANVLVPIDRDSFTWLPLNLTVAGEQLGNLPPMKVTRVKTK